MARPRKHPGSGALLEAAVNDIGLALANLQNVFEAEGGTLTAEQHQKVFAFLNVTLAGVEQKTRLSLSTTVLTSGKFSLDLDAPPPATPHAAAHTLHMPAAAIAGMPQRGPRVFGEPVPERPARSVPKEVKPLADMNKENSDDGVGFIGED